MARCLFQFSPARKLPASDVVEESEMQENAQILGNSKTLSPGMESVDGSNAGFENCVDGPTGVDR